MKGRRIERVWAAQGLIVVVCLMLAGLIGRLAYIQQKMRPQLLDWSQRRQSSTVPLAGRRGSIFDRQHRLLAGSQNQYTVYADPRRIESIPDAAEKLAAILQMPATEIRQLLEKPTSPAFVILKRGADKPEREAVQGEDLPGIGVLPEPARTYPMGSLAAHIVGFVGLEQNGQEGVELSCDRFLRATPGRRVVFYDASRNPMFQAPDSFVAPRDGMHVVLTIDSAIQEIVERELAAGVEHFKPESALAMVMVPKTGEILSMACWPGFAPAQAGKTPPALRRNRILTDPVEPGSVFKPFVMSAALHAGVVHLGEMIDCHDGIFGKRHLQDSHVHGTLTVEQVVSKSSNIGMAVVGLKLGNKAMYNALHDFGFGRPTGVDLPGEGAGLLMPLKKWNSYSTTSVPMGQELAVTPMQLMTAFCALANGGRLMQPRVVAAVVDQEGQIIEDHSAPVERGLAMEPATVAKMRDILIQVVNEGTGKSAQLDRWQVMGKTGTAQVPRTDRRGYEPDAYLGSFIAAAPASDPAVAVLVMMRKPNVRMGYYGSQVSAPVVKAILQQVLPYLNVPPDKAPAQKDTRLVME